jgi:hypothetical protein
LVPGPFGEGGARTDVIAPPPDELFSETDDNSVGNLLTYGTARVLLAGDAEAREEYVAGSYRAYTPGDPVWPVMIARDIPCSGSHQLDRDLLPQPMPTSSDSDRHAPTRILRKSLSVRALSNMIRHPDTH